MKKTSSAPLQVISNCLTFDLIKIQGNIDYEFNIRLSNEDDSAPFDLDLEDDEDEDDLREIMQSSQ